MKSLENLKDGERRQKKAGSAGAACMAKHEFKIGGIRFHVGYQLLVSIELRCSKASRNIIHAK